MVNFNKYKISKSTVLMISGVVIIIIAITISVFYQKELYIQPINVIERTLNVKLPSSYEIINYETNGSRFGCKILAKNQSAEDIKEYLNHFEFKQTIIKKTDSMTAYDVTLYNNVHSHGNPYTWWDLKLKNIESSYHSRFFYVFITKDIDSQNYIYIFQLMPVKKFSFFFKG